MYRILQPMAELQRIGYQRAEWGYRGDDRLAWIVHQFDAVIIPRLYWTSDQYMMMKNWFDALHRAGLAVIYEVDDDMFSDDFVKRLVEIHDKDPQKAEEIRKSILATLSFADGATVSSQRLATIMRQYTNKPVQVVPNSMDVDWFRAVQKREPRRVRGLTIGWAGGVRPDADVEDMAIAWGRIAQRYPDVTFVVMGHQAKVIYEHVPSARIQAVEWLPIETYPLGMANIDIGCCPLSDTHFNRAKTYIKAMEYAAGGAAVVASPTVYGQIIRHGENGFIATTADEWERSLTFLLLSSNRRKRIAQLLAREVETKYSLQDNVWRWPAAWQAILEDFKANRVTEVERKKILIPTWVKSTPRQPAETPEWSRR